MLRTAWWFFYSHISTNLSTCRNFRQVFVISARGHGGKIAGIGVTNAASAEFVQPIRYRRFVPHLNSCSQLHKIIQPKPSPYTVQSMRQPSP